MYVIKEPVLRLERFAECLKDFTGLEKGTIRLITHFGIAEVRYLEDFFHKFKGIKQINSSLSYSGNVGSFKIVVNDLFGYYPMALEKIGKGIVFLKVSIEGVGGKPESYWKAHMLEFLEKHPKEYEVYAKTDAEITITAFNELRAKYAAKGIEVLKLPTMTSVAYHDFRQNYLRKAAAETIFEDRVVGRKKNEKTGEWSDITKTVEVFDGDLNVRKLAGLASWGAINSLFWFGYRKSIKAFAQFLDVESLYVAAALLQPLPNLDTEWHDIKTIEDIESMEGFARVRFKFPDNELYPNLACKCDEMPDTTIFPLQGTTTETTSQLRQALKFGAELTEIKGKGFKPGPNEIDHDLGRFLRPVFAAKHTADTKSLEYKVYKNLMVSLIGRFQLKIPIAGLSDKIWHFKRTKMTVPEYVSSGRTKEYRPKEKGDKLEAGSGFVPEWSSLILGRARSIIAGIVHIGGCYHISTDGGWFDLDKIQEIMQSAEVQELRSVGSDLRPEGRRKVLKILKAWLTKCL